MDLKLTVDLSAIVTTVVGAGVLGLGKALFTEIKEIRVHLGQINGTVKAHNVQLEEIHRSGDQCRENVHREIDVLRERIHCIKEDLK